MNRSLIAALLAAPLLLAGCGSSNDTAAPAPAAAATPAATPASADGMHDGMAMPAATDTAALDFTAKTVNGATFSGSSLAAHAAVLWFWAPGCSECVKFAPTVLAVQRANPGVRFIGVAGLADAAAMKKAAASMHIDSFPQLADLRGVLWRKFGVTRQPAFAFIDINGKASVFKGAMGKVDLFEHTAALS